MEALGLLKGIQGIGFIFFSKRDVVRHRLVQEIIEAYEKAEHRKTLSGNLME
ncbi:MAG: PhoH family protein [Desulforhabdus sp.]|nr:PhoH family protein [Desulforhabdus sp.]